MDTVRQTGGQAIILTEMRGCGQAGKAWWKEGRQKTDRQTDGRADSQTDRNAWFGTSRVGRLEGRKTVSGQTGRQTDGRAGSQTDMDRSRGRGQPELPGCCE